MKQPEPCPCGCGEEVPKRGHNHFAKREPHWEWICVTATCKVRHTRMLNQTGDSECSWCGRERAFVGHFPAGAASKNSRDRRTVGGKVVRYEQMHNLIRQTPKHLIRPFQDVT